MRFRAEEGGRYLVAARAMAPELVRVRRSDLLKKTRRAQWILIGPEPFLDEAKPLVQLRKAQGLRPKAVSIESIYDGFGHGEQRPEAIRDFLSAVYHETGSLQYVVLLGDGTFDFEDSSRNRCPKPSAAFNGEDELSVDRVRSCLRGSERRRPPPRHRHRKTSGPV